VSNTFKNFEQIKICVEYMLTGIPGDETLDLQPLFFRLTLHTTMVLLFGTTISALQPSKELHEFSDAFTVAQEYLSYRSRVGGLYWLFDSLGFRKACRTVHSFVDAIVQEALNKADSRGNILAEESPYAFIDAMMQQTREKKALRDQCLNILLAGRDTTACCLTWTM
jgi:cytochrome P450